MILCWESVAFYVNEKVAFAGDSFALCGHWEFIEHEDQILGRLQGLTRTSVTAHPPDPIVQGN